MLYCAKAHSKSWLTLNWFGWGKKIFTRWIWTESWKRKLKKKIGEEFFYNMNLNKKLRNMRAKKPAQAVIQGGPDFGHCIQGGSTWALCICVRTKASPVLYTLCIRLYTRVRTIVYACTHNCIRVYAQLYTSVRTQLYRARPVVVACATDCWALGSNAPGPIRH